MFPSELEWIVCFSLYFVYMWSIGQKKIECPLCVLKIFHMWREIFSFSKYKVCENTFGFNWYNATFTQYSWVMKCSQRSLHFLVVRMIFVFLVHFWNSHRSTFYQCCSIGNLSIVILGKIHFINECVGKEHFLRLHLGYWRVLRKV